MPPRPGRDRGCRPRDEAGGPRHEGAGIVEQVGEAVTDLQVGDRVALSSAWCEYCPACPTGRPAHCEPTFQLNSSGAREDGSATTTAADGSVVRGNSFGQSSCATHALVAARGAVKVPDSVDLELVGPLGCGFQTDAGAIVDTLAVKAGDSVVVSGAGAVGSGSSPPVRRERASRSRR